MMWAVAPRTVAAEPDQWAMVGQAVYERRSALNLTAKDVIERAGVGLSLTVLSAIENARQASYSERSMKALCRGLGWTPESIDLIIKGGQPIIVGGEPPTETVQEEILRRLAKIEDLLEQIAVERRARGLPTTREPAPHS